MSGWLAAITSTASAVPERTAARQRRPGTPAAWLRLHATGSTDGFHCRVTAGSRGRWPGRLAARGPVMYFLYGKDMTEEPEWGVWQENRPRWGCCGGSGA